MALLIVFFFPPLSLLDKKIFPLHFIRGYWRHVGLTWHIRFIISCPGMIMVIDTVTSCPPAHAIGYQCLPLSRFQEDAVRGGGSEHYHGRLMGVNCGGRCLARVRPRVANVAHSILCHVDDVGGRPGGGPDWVSIPLWTNNTPVSVISSTGGIQHIHHTYGEKGESTRGGSRTY